MSTSRFTFVVCLFTCFLNCSTSTEVTAEPGDDAILHCHGHKDADIELLEWIKLDLNSDKYVFFFRENQRYEHYQHPLFRGRVTLRDPTMKDGDASVILRNVTMKDAGTYQCYVGKRSSQHSKRSGPELINTITLKVEEHKDVTVKSGDRVTLPCQDFRLSPVEYLKWVRPDLDDEGYVFMFRDGRSVPDKQHQYYKNRVELKDTEMKDGDLSLILRNVMPVHSGTYYCYVNQEGTNLRMKSIHLTVEPDTNKGGGDTALAPVVLFILLLLVGIVGFLFYKKQRGLTVLVTKTKQRLCRKLKL